MFPSRSCMTDLQPTSSFWRHCLTFLAPSSHQIHFSWYISALCTFHFFILEHSASFSGILFPLSSTYVRFNLFFQNQWNSSSLTVGNLLYPTSFGSRSSLHQPPHFLVACSLNLSFLRVGILLFIFVYRACYIFRTFGVSQAKLSSYQTPFLLDSLATTFLTNFSNSWSIEGGRFHLRLGPGQPQSEYSVYNVFQ